MKKIFALVATLAAMPALADTPYNPPRTPDEARAAMDSLLDDSIDFLSSGLEGFQPELLTDPVSDLSLGAAQTCYALSGSARFGFLFNYDHGPGLTTTAMFQRVRVAAQPVDGALRPLAYEEGAVHYFNTAADFITAYRPQMDPRHATPHFTLPPNTLIGCQADDDEMLRQEQRIVNGELAVAYGRKISARIYEDMSRFQSIIYGDAPRTAP